MKTLNECMNINDVLIYLDEKYHQVRGLQSKGMLTQGMTTTIERIIREAAATKILTYED